MRASRVFLLCLTSLLFLAATPADRRSPVAATETGTFRLHKFEQAIRQENFTVENTANEVTVTAAFEFVDRGTHVPLNAKLRTDANLVPISFSAVGNVARGTTLDVAAEATRDRIHIRLEKDSKDLARPEKFFFIS